MKLYFRAFLIFIFLLAQFCYAAPSSNHGLDGFQTYVIDATKNARGHNNMGNIYFEQGNYIAALKEYEIAFRLTYNTSASATYLYNMARCYIKFNNYTNAKNLLLGAIDKDCMNITYYKALVDCYSALSSEKQELKKCLKDYQNPYNRITAGLIYLKMGKKSAAKMIFDEFINNNPDMLITEDVKAILRNL